MSDSEALQCDTAEEVKKVPPDLEVPQPETPKQDVPVQNKPPSFPLKNSHFLPLQNGPLQQPEPSAAVAAVTVPTSAANPATVSASSHLSSSNSAPLPSSTSPAGGVPFPTSLLNHQEEFPVSPTAASKTVSPVLGSKGYDSVVKSTRGANNDVVHSLPYPISSSYSDYTVNYSANQYSNNNKHSYLNQEVNNSQRPHHQQKVVTNNYYNHHHQQQPVDKYHNPKDAAQRSNSKDSFSCDGYKTENYLENRFENSKGADLAYCVGQVYTNEKTCDPQTVCKKPTANNVYNFKTNELLTQNSNENVVKNSTDKIGGKLTGYCDPNVNKTKVPNRTTYYQSIVNKSHSRHKSSRRVLPASAYENSKQVINSYSTQKPELPNQTKPVQYSSHHYNSETKKHDYYPPLSTASSGTTNTYNCTTYKTDPQQTHLNNNISHNSYPESQSSSRNYKTNPELCASSYRDKQTVNSVSNSNTKPYTYQQNSRSYHDAPSKVSTDATHVYGNNDYYQKGNLTYSKSGTNQSAISDNFKSSNHSSEHSTYQSKNLNYHHSRTSSEKSNRNYYPNQEGSYKSYRQDLVPKQTSDDPHGYRVHHSGNYQNYDNSNTLKSKETVPEPSKHVSSDHHQNASTESNPVTHPPISDNSTSYQAAPAKDKPPFYPYSDQSHYHHRRTPPTVSLPPSKSAAFEPITPTKETEPFRLSNSSTIPPSHLPRPAVSSPITVSDSSRQTGKTLWSPTATTNLSTTTTNREVITASSRDSHSSHSNSSISSLSQLSQSLGSAPQGTTVQSSKEYSREGRSSSNGHSRSSSRNETPVCSAIPVTTTCSTSASSSSSSSYGVSGSLTSLIFSKPSWTSPSVTTVLTNPGGSHFTPPASGRLGSPVPSVLPLAPSLPSSHHSSPFSNHPSAASLHSAGHHVMFAPPLPPAGSLSSPSLPLASASGPSPFGGESLFAPPPPSQDLLNIRRELDTRFLASQDRSINVPPPPYLRAEMHQHQHQHTHMHQHSPFLPPPLGGSLLPPSAAHLYDKFPKVDSSFYGRNALGLPTYPSLSPLLAPGSASATPTPFAPPGHMAAFQPKISPLVKAKTVKSGRWCAMHVRISWEIYHHQQKTQAESQKGGSGPTKSVADLLRPPNHLFGSIPRPHELGFSSPLLGAAASLHARSPYEVSSQHPSFLGPTPAHLGITPFARPNYPSMGVPGNSFAGLGSLAGLTGASMLAGRELGPGYLAMSQDPWSRLHRTPPNFPSPSAMNPTSWGGLKAEAERDRMQKREDQEREKEKEKQKRADMEKREKEAEKSKEIARESKKEHEKQKERDRESRVSHISSNPEVARNGELMERNRDRDWERVRERRDNSRSPIRSTHKPDGAFESSNNSGHKSEIKVKEEKKEDEQHNKDSSSSSSSDRERTKPSEPSHQEAMCDYMSRGMIPGLPMGLTASEQARLAGSLGAIPPPHFWNPLPPQSAERYRNLELQHAREMDREQLMQKYASLSSVMPLLPERYREAELARHLSSSEAAAREVERQLQADRDRQVYERTKLPPPPLRPNDPPYVPPPGLPPSGGLFPSITSPFLNSLCAPNYPPRTKPGSPGGIGNGIPPPLIPCVSQGGSPVTTSTTPSPLHLKLGTSNVENTRDHYASKERRDMVSYSAGEVESQSR